MKPALSTFWIHPLAEEARSAKPVLTLKPAASAEASFQSDRADLGVGEGHSRQRPVVRRSKWLSENVGRDDLGLVHRDVRESPDAGDVADRPEPGRRTASFVDRDRARLVVKADRSHVQRREIGPAPGSYKEMIALHRLAGRKFDTIA